MKAIFTGLGFALAVAGMASAQGQPRCADYVPQPKPQNASRDIVGQDLDQIIDRGFITFAVYEDFAPWSWEEKGKPRGVDIEIGRIIAEDLGVEPRFNFVAAGENLDADLRNNIWKGPIVGGAVSNIMLHVPYDSNFICRVEQVVFTGQAYSEAIAIAYDEAAFPEEKPVPAYFRFDTVGVENDSISDFYLTSMMGGAMVQNMTRYPSTLAAMDGMAAGEVRAVMGPRGELDYGLREGLGVHQPPLVGFGVGKWTLGIAVHFAYRGLSYAADDAVRYALEDGRIEAIFADYGLTFQPPER
ncbi:MAG: substrate-binding periplasmic protein [Mangrovicoccus sp.]